MHEARVYLKKRLPFTSGVDHDFSSHITGIVLMGLLVVLPFFMNVDFSALNDTGRVSLQGFQLPSMCMSREVFGVECPGCGLTRSFVALAHGDWIESFGFHRLGPVLYLYLFTLILFHLYGALVARNRELPRILTRAHHWGGLIIVTFLFVNWIWVSIEESLL